MELTIEWQRPVQLTRKFTIIVPPDIVPAAIEPICGVYFFSRRNGKSYLPFYIGESLNLRRRFYIHMKSRAIADALRGLDINLKNGTRYFHYGYFKGKSGQNNKRCIKIIQKYMIRDAVEAELYVLNKQLTKPYKTHTILFEGVPRRRGWFDRRSIVEAK